MKKILVVIFCFLCNYTINAQINFTYAKQIGGSLDDDCRTIANDSDGNIYIGGSFQGTVDFDPGPGSYTVASAGGDDAYILKLNASGNFLNVWTLNNNLQCKIYSIAIDNFNNIIASGAFSGAVDFDPGTGVTQLTGGAYNDIFVLKLNSNGNFAWAKSFGYPTNDDYGYSVTTDNNNNVLLTGYFRGTNIDFDPGVATYTLSATAKDVFILKLDPNANFIWAFNIGSSLDEEAKTIKTDASGNVYVAGYFSATADFDPSASTQNITPAGTNTYDAFIAKYSSAGTYLWAGAFSGPGLENCSAIQIDVNNNLYLTGSFAGSPDFDPGVGTFNLNSFAPAIFLTKLNSSGGFIWAKSFSGGGGSGGSGNAVAIDYTGIYTLGYFQGMVDFDPSVNIFNLNANGGSDAFISKLDFNGNFIYAISFGGFGNDFANAIITPSTGVAFAVGSFSGAVDFDAGADTVLLVSNGNTDTFVQKLNTNTVGIHENSNIEPVLIFPNPVKSELSIVNQPGSDIEIYNSIGELVYSTINIDSNFMIDMSHLDSGIYFVNIIKNKNRVCNPKIIKQ